MLYAEFILHEHFYKFASLSNSDVVVNKISQIAFLDFCLSW